MSLLGLFRDDDHATDFPAGETVFEEGTAGDLMYVIVDGEVDVKVHGETIFTASPGEVIGEMALIDSHTRSATAVARTDCRLAPMDRKAFKFMVQQTPFFSLQMLRILATRLRRMNAQWRPAASLEECLPEETLSPLGLFQDEPADLTFSAGATIFTEGDPGDVMLAVLEGELEVRVHGAPVAVLHPGEFVGEMALIDAAPRSATVLARTDCHLAQVDEKRFLHMVQQNPLFALHVMCILASRLRRMDAAWGR